MPSFEGQLHIEFGKMKTAKPSRADQKHAVKEAMRVAPPTPAEREAFLKAQNAEGRAIFLEAEKEQGLMAKAKQPKNLVLGLSLGAGVLLLAGAPILLPAAAAGGAYYIYKRYKPGCMTPDRQKVYEEALRTLKDPVKLKTLADAFEKEGCTKEADLLRKRAALRELPKEKQQERRKVFRAAMQSSNVHGVETLAAAFEGEGATGAAEALRVHAAALKSL